MTVKIKKSILDPDNSFKLKENDSTTDLVNKVQDSVIELKLAINTTQTQISTWVKTMMFWLAIMLAMMGLNLDLAGKLWSGLDKNNEKISNANDKALITDNRQDVQLATYGGEIQTLKDIQNNDKLYYQDKFDGLDKRIIRIEGKR